MTSVEQRRGATCGATGDAGSSRQVPASPGPALEVVPILLKDIPHSTILPLCIHIRKFYFEEASNRISGRVKSL